MTQPAQRWVAVLGRRDTPTDGVEDYCTFLGRALAEQGTQLDLARVEWFDRGWIPALWSLWRASEAWRGNWVLVQYTGLGWSRRGFPVGVLAAIALLRRRGCRCAIVFHEFARQGGRGRAIGRLRGSCQQWVIGKLYASAAKCVFTVPLERVRWLPQEHGKAAFIPIGANIPERWERTRATETSARKTVIVFGVTADARAAGEVEEIAGAMREASKSLPALRLVVIGRGAMEARKRIEAALAGSGVEIGVRGVLPAEEVANEFARADALLFVRGPVTLQRGSALAAVACGVPIVGYRSEESGGPLDEAGIEWSQQGDREGLVRALVRVLSDPAHWTDLRERSLRAQREYFSWSRIAERFAGGLTE